MGITIEAVEIVAVATVAVETIAMTAVVVMTGVEGTEDAIGIISTGE